MQDALIELVEIPRIAFKSGQLHEMDSLQQDEDFDSHHQVPPTSEVQPCPAAPAQPLQGSTLRRIRIHKCPHMRNLLLFPVREGPLKPVLTLTAGPLKGGLALFVTLPLLSMQCDRQATSSLVSDVVLTGSFLSSFSRWYSSFPRPSQQAVLPVALAF